MSAFKLNGKSIKSPSSFKLERYKVTTLERTTSGDMVGDLLAKKLKFYFTYEAIDAKDLDVILEAIWDCSGIFFEIEYPYQGETRRATVYPGSIPSELHRGTLSGKSWVWKNVTFDLIER